MGQRAIVQWNQAATVDLSFKKTILTLKHKHAYLEDAKPTVNYVYAFRWIMFLFVCFVNVDENMNSFDHKPLLDCLFFKLHYLWT